MRDDGVLRPYKNSDLRKKETRRVFGDRVARYQPDNEDPNDKACLSSEAEEVPTEAHVNSEEKDDEEKPEEETRMVLYADKKTQAKDSFTVESARSNRYKAPPPGITLRSSSAPTSVLEPKIPAKKPGKAPPESLRHPAGESRPPSQPPPPATTREGRDDWNAAVKAGPPMPGPPNLPTGPPRPPIRMESVDPERQARNVQSDGSGQIAKHLIERSRDRSPSRGRSRDRRPGPSPEPQGCDWTRSRSASAAPWHDKRPTWHDKYIDNKQAKRKREESTRGSSAPPKKPVDNFALLSDKSRTFHENMVAAAPAGSVGNGTWKDDVFSVHDIREVINKDALDGMIQHGRELQIAKNPNKKAQNKRIYIGPGRTGDTDDKISVDFKLTPRPRRSHVLRIGSNRVTVRLHLC